MYNNTNKKWSETRLRTLDVLRHVVVNDHRYVLDVDTSTGDVCGHQDIFSSCLKVGEGELSLLLAFTTVQRAGIVLQRGTRGHILFFVIWTNMEESGLLTPIFSRDLASTSQPFFWLTKMMMGGSKPFDNTSSSFFLHSKRRRKRG